MLRFHPLHFFQEQKGVTAPVYCSLIQGLGRNVNKMLILLHAPVLLSSHHLFFCRLVQFTLTTSYLSLLLSNFSALLLDLGLGFVRTTQVMSPWLFSSDVLDNVEAAFSLGLMPVNCDDYV